MKKNILLLYLTCRCLATIFYQAVCLQAALWLSPGLFNHIWRPRKPKTLVVPPVFSMQAGIFSDGLFHIPAIFQPL